ncbi:MAG: class I SAM-dependent methyltransferase [Planctomycetaceae bacterium]|nr:class I SAM-dependent methyltransferase [Planctomycetaceae bacterium]
MDDAANIKKLYNIRFSKEQLSQKNDIWKVLCNDFFQKYISENSVVVDVGAGYCEFINNIRCAGKYAIDLSDDTSKFAAPGVKVIKELSTNLSSFKDASADVCFMSNFLEHLCSKQEIMITLTEVFRILKPEGKILILQPNIRYLYNEYWDFFDHHIPLSDKSVVEALQIAGFNITEVIDKFLPYTTKSKIPQNRRLVKLYLKVPLLWKILGKQAFICGTKTISL